MADGTRLRYDGVETYLDIQLESDVNTIQLTEPLRHDGGIPIDTLQTDEFLALSILDSNYRLREIVHLTAYTAGDTFGTIERAMEGTINVTHPAGAKVVHASTVEDFLLIQDHDKDLNAHRPVIEAIAQGLIDTALNNHVGDTDPSLSVDDPHPYYVRKSGAYFIGPVTFSEDNTVTVQGSLNVPAGAVVNVEGDLNVTGKFTVNGRQLWISNTPPPTLSPDIVWIQTYGQI